MSEPARSYPARPPPIPLEQRDRHVVGSDLRELRPGALRAFKAEHERLAEQSGLPPSAIALLMLLSVLPRPQGRSSGAGLQISLERQGEILGYSRRQMAYAQKRLKRRRLIARYRRLVPLPQHYTHTSKKRGVVRHWRADIFAVTYLTAEGCWFLSERGFTSAWDPAQQKRIRTRTAGSVRFLLRKLSLALRKCSRRLAGSGSDCTPTKGIRRIPLFLGRESSALPVGKELAPSGSPTWERSERAQAPPSTTNAEQCGPGGRKSKNRPVRDFDRDVEFCLNATIVYRDWKTRSRYPDGGFPQAVKGPLVRSRSPITHVREFLPPGLYDAHPSSQAEYERDFEPVRRAVVAQLIKEGFRP